MGFLLDEPDEAKVFKAIEREWKDDETARRNRVQRKKRNKWWRQGKRFARLEDKIEDKGLIKATLPPGMSSQPPMPNKVDDLCRKIVAQVTVDPPAPEVEPETDSDEDRGAAEFATRFLKSDGGEAGTKDADLFRKAIDHGTTAGSDFVLTYVDPFGGGWRPQEIKAAPTAIDPENPLIDPTTGAPGVEFVTRYVGTNGQITDDPAEAARQWLPKMKACLVPCERAAFVPNTIADPDDASGIVFLMYDTLSDLRARYEQDEEPWGDDFVKDLVTWKPDKLKELLPPSISKAVDDREKKNEKGDKPKDSTVVFYLLAYRKSQKEYPEGAEVLVSGGGDGHVIARAPLPKQGKKQEVCDMPFVQLKQLEDVDGDVMGQAIIEKFGAADEQRAMVLSAWNEFLDQVLNPNVFIPSTSPVQPKALAMRDGTPITVLSKEDLPFYEPQRTFPPDGKQYFELVTNEMDNASGLQQAAQGVSTPNVQSGIHAREVIEQSLVALGELFQNYQSAVRRFWRIKLQWARAKMEVPQLMGYMGDDGSFKQDYWTGADFTGARDVAIARGSGTMMSPSQKQQWVLGLLTAVPGMPLIDPEDAKDAIRSGVQGNIGMQDDPHLLRVKRQIAEWSDGPPESFAMVPQVDQTTGQPGLDQMGQPLPPQPNFTPFDPRPNDEEPQVAHVRHREMTRFMSGSQYAKQPPEWRQVFDAEYQRMAMSAGVQTVRQQQQAQQQAQQQQAQAQQQQMAANASEKDKDRVAQLDTKAVDHQLQMQKQDTSAQLEAQKLAIAASRQGTPQGA